MQLLFPLGKNNLGDRIISNDERMRIIEDVKKVVKISVRNVLSGELDVGEFIMTRVYIFSAGSDFRDYGLGLLLEIIRGSRRILQLWIKSESEIRGECSKTASGRLHMELTKYRVSYVLIQAPPNAKGFEKAEVSTVLTRLMIGSRICHCPRTIARLELLSGAYNQEPSNSHSRVSSFNTYQANQQTFNPSKRYSATIRSHRTGISEENIRR